MEGGQPCEECAQMERKVLIAAVLGGALMGVGVCLFVVSKVKK